MLFLVKLVFKLRTFLLSYIGKSATKRKLAVIIWNMVVKNTYTSPTQYLFLDEKESSVW